MKLVSTYHILCKVSHYPKPCEMYLLSWARLYLQHHGFGLEWWPSLGQRIMGWEDAWDCWVMLFESRARGGRASPWLIDLSTLIGCHRKHRTLHCRKRERKRELCYQYCLLKRVIMCSFMVLSVLKPLIESHTMRMIQNFPPDKGQSEPFHRTQWEQRNTVS